METERGRQVNRKLVSHPKESGLYRRGRTFLPGFREEKGDFLLQEQRKATAGKRVTKGSPVIGRSGKGGPLLEEQRRAPLLRGAEKRDFQLEIQGWVTLHRSGKTYRKRRHSSGLPLKNYRWKKNNNSRHVKPLSQLSAKGSCPTFFRLSR